MNCHLSSLTIVSVLPQELVQVESLAQLGVQLLLFTLGLEFSMAKLRAVRSVALLGGLPLLGSFESSAGLFWKDVPLLHGS